MRLFRRESKLEQLLRTQRPQPSAELTRTLSARISDVTRPPTRFTRSWRPAHLRLGLAATLTAALLVGLASVGGLGYAASAAKKAADAIEQAVASEGGRELQGTGGGTMNAGGDQYRPGYGWGDPNHTHTGPPGLEQRGQVRLRRQGDSTIVSFRLFLDEQADLFISVLGPNGRRLPLSANDLRLPQGDGTGTRLRYRVLVPRTLRLSLRLPSAELERGTRYTIRIVARDPNNQQSKLRIRFRA